MGYLQDSPFIVTDLADPFFPLGDMAAVTAGKTNHPIPCKLFKEEALGGLCLEKLFQGALGGHEKTCFQPYFKRREGPNNRCEKSF